MSVLAALATDELAQGEYDAFLGKYDAAGNLLWTRQLGTSSNDQGRDVSADSLGNVYLSGRTGGSLGGPNAGSDDAFLGKYDAAGNLLWTRQLGTPNRDTSWGVSADGLGNVYLTGRTLGSLGGPRAGSNDAFLGKYDAAGNLLWTRQLGTSSDDQGWDVSADSLGNVYLGGRTEGSLGGPNAGLTDAFLGKYDAAGNLLWTRQLGAHLDDTSCGVSADGLGNVYLSGFTVRDIGLPHGRGVSDILLGKYDAAGNLLWTRQLSTTSGDWGTAVSTDGLGNVYLTGYTGGSLGGPHAGNPGDGDAFVAKLVVPEPGTLLLLAMAALALTFGWWRRRPKR